MPDLFKNKYKIKSTRLEYWDYSQAGYYFVTICTKNREMFFGKIINDKMVLSEIGKSAVNFWLQIPKHFPCVVLDEFIVMPNHVHGILFIETSIETPVETQNFASLPRASLRMQYKNKFGPQSKNLSSIIRGFKIGVKKYAVINNIDFNWQPRFYDRIIRDEIELSNVRNYILNNPFNWKTDRNNLKIM